MYLERSGSADNLEIPLNMGPMTEIASVANFYSERMHVR